MKKWIILLSSAMLAGNVLLGGNMLPSAAAAVNIVKPFGITGEKIGSGAESYIAAEEGSHIRAVMSGTVLVNYEDKVIIGHADGTKFIYAGCSSIAVSKGQQVRAGETIALSGNCINLEYRDASGHSRDPLPVLGENNWGI